MAMADPAKLQGHIALDTVVFPKGTSGKSSTVNVTPIADAFLGFVLYVFNRNPVWTNLGVVTQSHVDRFGVTG